MKQRHDQPHPAASPLWRRRLAAAGICVSGAAGQAWAQPYIEQQRTWDIDVGVYASYVFGGGRAARWSGGLELRQLSAPRGLYECGARKTSYYYGAAARLALVGWPQVRLVVAPQIGALKGPYSFGAELAVGARLRNDPGLVLQPGLEAAISHGFVRVASNGVDDHHVALGARNPALGDLGGFNCVTVVPGRPLRRQAGRAPLPDLFVVDDDCPPAARLWADRARAEWASVPAFLELGEQLAALGAPAELRRRALQAADDELHHAILAAGMASDLSGSMLILGAPTGPTSAQRRAPESGTPGLVRLAMESWTDGCIGEGAAAACAAAEARTASTDDLRDTCRIIAADERRHAELGWDVLRWALQVGRQDLGAQLARAGQPSRPSAAPSEAQSQAEARARLTTLLAA